MKTVDYVVLTSILTAHLGAYIVGGLKGVGLCLLGTSLTILMISPLYFQYR